MKNFGNTGTFVPRFTNNVALLWTHTYFMEFVLKSLSKAYLSNIYNGAFLRKQRFLAVTYFRKKLSSQMFYRVLIMPLFNAYFEQAFGHGPKVYLFLFPFLYPLNIALKWVKFLGSTSKDLIRLHFKIKPE